MAQYIRFEIYIPVVCTTRERDSRSGLELIKKHALDDIVLRQFIEEAIHTYEGLTQANPLAQALYKGWWRSRENAAIEVDYLTYLFGLIRIDQAAEAMAFFSEWKQRFEEETYQKVILLLYYPVQTIGDFF